MLIRLQCNCWLMCKLRAERSVKIKAGANPCYMSPVGQDSRGGNVTQINSHCRSKEVEWRGVKIRTDDFLPSPVRRLPDYVLHHNDISVAICGI
ncbi:uncharacterized [Tachysurus ichikawai]